MLRLSLCVTLMLVACGGTPAASPPAPTALPAATTAVPAPTATLAPTPTVKSPPLPTIHPTAPPVAGPWVIYWTGQEMLATLETCPNLAARGRHVTNPYNQFVAIASPAGSWSALLTSNIADGTTYYIYADLRLELVHLPDCTHREVGNLLSADIQKRVTTPDGSGPPTAIFAVRGGLPAQWSPDGTQIAFVAALAGDTADLYTYTLSDGRVSRLTGGPSHVLGFWWSPDSRWIVYHAGMPSRPHFDPALEGVYAVAASGSAARRLYAAPIGALGEPFDGWVADDTFVVHGPTAPQQFSLRAVNLATGNTATLSTQYMESAAVDPHSGTVAYVALGDAKGTYIVSAAGGAPRRIYAGDVRDIRWAAPLNRFLLDTAEGVLSLAADGGQVVFKGETLGYFSFAVAPDGSALAFFDMLDDQVKTRGAKAGIRLYAPNGGLQTEIAAGKAIGGFAFRPDGRVLVYTLREDANGYYLLRASDGQPAHIATDAPVRALGWAGP